MKHNIKYVLTCLAAVLLLAVSPSYAQDVTKQQQKKAALEKEIALLDKQIADIKKESSSATSRLELLRQNIANRKLLIAESDRLIRSYEDSVKVKNNEISELESEVDNLLEYYGKMIRNAYEYRDPHIWYLYVFASDNLGQAFRRAGYFRNISNQIRSKASEIREKQAELEYQKQVLDTLKQQAVQVKQGRTAELNALSADEKEAEKLVTQLTSQRKKIEGQIAAKKKEVEALNREIQKKIEEAQKKKKNTSSGGKTANQQDVKLSGEFANNKGKLPWPVNGVLVRSYGKQYHPVFKNLELPSNDGIDIAVDAGGEVCSVFEGEVLDVFVMPSYGQCVLVQHGSTYFTFYCKLGSIVVKKGEKVRTGQKLGVVEPMNGTSQIHFEIWKDKSPQNPSSWLRSK